MRSLAHLDDFACVTLARRGEGAAFSELVRRYQDRIYRFLLRLTGAPDDARDLAQETFLRAYRGLEQWRPDAQFKTWLFRIARNLAFDRLRRDKIIDFVELDEDAEVPDPAAGPEAAMETAQRYQALEAALERLPAPQREILLLREIEEMSYEEIAEVLKLNSGTVKSRIARARTALLGELRSRQELPS